MASPPRRHRANGVLRALELHVVGPTPPAAAGIAVNAAAQQQPPPACLPFIDVAKWERDGVLYLPNFFSEAEMDALMGCVDTLLQDVPPPSAADAAGFDESLVDPWSRGRQGGVAGLYTQKFDTEMIRLDGQITKHYPETIAMLETNPKLVAATQYVHFYCKFRLK